MVSIDRDLLDDLAEALLASAGEAVDAVGIAGITRRFTYAGEKVPWDGPGFLAVAYGEVYLGQPGHRQFGSLLPGDGGWAQQSADLTVTAAVKHEVPKASGGLGNVPRLDADRSTREARAFHQLGWVLFNYLTGLGWLDVMFGEPGPNMKPCLVGPMKAAGPQGGLVGWECAVSLQII